MPRVARTAHAPRQDDGPEQSGSTGRDGGAGRAPGAARPRGTTWRWAVFWLPLALLWGAPLAGVLLLPGAADDAEATAASAPMPTTVEVGGRERTGLRSVSVGFDVTSPPAPFLTRDGRLTAVLYSPGTVLAEGDELVEVDGATVRVHRGERPFYRDVARGTVGKDVTELVRYLTAAGVDGARVEPGEKAGRALHEAIVAYQRANGLTVDGIFRPGDVVHLDAATASLGEPEVSVGMRVSDGTVIAQGEGVATSGTVLGTNGDVVTLDVPGPYVLTGPGDLRVPVDPGSLHGPEAEALRATLREAGLTATPPDAFSSQEVFGSLSISAADPVSVGAVAATAIGAGPDGTFCVFRLAPGADPATAVAVPLGLATTLEGETTVAAVDHDLVGVSVARVAAHLPPAVTAGCR